MWTQLPSPILQEIVDVDLYISRRMLGVCKSWTQAFTAAKPRRLIVTYDDEDDDDDDIAINMHDTFRAWNHLSMRKVKRTLALIKHCPDASCLETVEMDLSEDVQGTCSVALAGAISVKFTALSAVSLHFEQVQHVKWLQFLPTKLKQKLAFEWVLEGDIDLGLVDPDSTVWRSCGSC